MNTLYRKAALLLVALCTIVAGLTTVQAMTSSASALTCNDVNRRHSFSWHDYGVRAGTWKIDRWSEARYCKTSAGDPLYQVTRVGVVFDRTDGTSCKELKAFRWVNPDQIGNVNPDLKDKSCDGPLLSLIWPFATPVNVWPSMGNEESCLYIDGQTEFLFTAAWWPWPGDEPICYF